LNHGFIIICSLFLLHSPTEFEIRGMISIRFGDKKKKRSVSIPYFSRGEFSLFDKKPLGDDE